MHVEIISNCIYSKMYKKHKVQNSNVQRLEEYNAHTFCVLCTTKLEPKDIQQNERISGKAFPKEPLK